MKLNRKIGIYIWIAAIVIILVISIILLGVYFNKDKVDYIKYSENGNVEYNVLLNKNEYFNNKYLEEGKQYIASLIDSIVADFNYSFELEETAEYTYDYNIVANVNVIDNNTNKIIYNISDELLSGNGDSNYKFILNENVKVDYNKYNKLINKFVALYNLNNVTSKLSVSMNVSAEGITKEFKKEGSTIALDIPLTTNTVSIDVNHNLSNGEQGLIPLDLTDNNGNTLLVTAISLIIVAVGLVVGLKKYIKVSSTDEEKYNVQMKKILNSYGSYISKVEDDFDMKGYQILKVENFVDLLEIRDTMHIPIILIENKQNLVACFIIPTNNKILYFYSLGATQYGLPMASEKNEEKYEQKI